MNILKKLFLSMESMTLLLVMFAAAIGVATFLENDYGTEAAKAMVYNARWFEVLLVLLAVNLIYNVFKYKMWRRAKWLSLLFHASFLVILLGAATTRYIGFEGTMHIREGGSSNRIDSAEAFLQVRLKENGLVAQKHKKLLMSPFVGNSFSESVSLNGKKVRVTYKDFVPTASQQMVESEGGDPIIQVMVSSNGQAQEVILRRGDVYNFSGFRLSFGADVKSTVPTVRIDRTEQGFQFLSNIDAAHVDMVDESETQFPANELHVFEPMNLYAIGSTMIVMKDYLESGVLIAVPSETEGGVGSGSTLINALLVDVVFEDTIKQATLFGGRGIPGDPQTLHFNDLEVELEYGAVQFETPFSIQLVDFQIDRYPGSNSPSSYASEVIIRDAEKGINNPFRIYMNHILQHRGYRFFQSSYDPDELGTILSVSFDPGTPVTYIGYVLLAIGLLFNFLNKNSRFRYLGKMVQKVQAQKMAMLVLALLLTGSTIYAQHVHTTDPSTIHKIDATHAAKFGDLFVQDSQGRVKPVNTLGHEILYKVSRTTSIAGLEADQIILGMLMLPGAWQQVDMIRVKHPILKTTLGLAEDQKYAAFSDFFVSGTNQYKLAKQVEAADRKRPALRDKLDKELIKVDERLNICYLVYVGYLLRIFPKQNDANNTWYSFEDALKVSEGLETEAVSHLMTSYQQAVNTALQTSDWTAANVALESIKEYQAQTGKAILPQPARRKAEVFMNQANLFSRAGSVYLLTGLVTLIVGFIRVFRSTKSMNWLVTILVVILAIGFLVHTTGLILRWYVSGHAPWSNGYESMIYIAWATMLAGLIFAKREPMPLAATGVLAGLTLFVAHLSWMDPQITTLVPVLKSYWLMIHVSMITASYGFLGLGALLGFLTLVLFIFKTKKNAGRVELSIKELSMINEQTLTIGLVLLTIGNFLGAVWANESWGRYWGWDPKETWALVTILIYATVVHFHLIPKLKSYYIFNVAALLAFASVIMTYFGVNYYLSGLHSYAQGDPVPIPTFVYYTVATVVVVIVLAFRSRRMGEIE